MLKLNLGCGNRKIYGFTNVDQNADLKPDVVDDVWNLTKFSPKSVNLIYASHVLEHAPRGDVDRILRSWYDLLKPNGEIYVAVPNIEEGIKHYIYYGKLEELQCLFWGGQAYNGDYHLNGFDKRTLSLSLQKAGFVNIDIYDPWQTSWHYVDDHSKSSYPTCNVDFVHGKGHLLTRLMSLNMKAIKL